ncbi:HesA/MoeB/ThiF family protein [Legionella spiritensis]|uniref:Molybdopterin-synthase adenylyltransferase n=1 Tax=Legionella spiritensis TaxID=452 RepID=A0A0W0Z4M5_LEGSP|nr:HesA/MoeB/ThiF family protein [Legionella spiritensis]KTD64084.1 sulfurylase ThiF [Legionella spiritensis]SNV37680.1 sulfurylase ThiF [Legionella spiritensis]
MSSNRFSAQELIRYSRQMALEEIGFSGQQKLKAARVLCAGLGGLGSPLSLYLAAAGVGTIGLVDGDRVEVGNLHRQILYRSSQVDESKALSAQKQLLSLNPCITVNVYPEKLTADNAVDIIGQYDIIADGTDNFKTRYLIHDVCFQLEKPYVYASVSQFTGYCSIFSGGQGPCLRCVFPQSPQEQATMDCNGNGVLGMLPGMLGIIQATEIMKWLVQAGQSLNNRLLKVDLLNMIFKDIRLARNPDCKLCASTSSCIPS